MPNTPRGVRSPQFFLDGSSQHSRATTGEQHTLRGYEHGKDTAARNWEPPEEWGHDRTHKARSHRSSRSPSTNASSAPTRRSSAATHNEEPRDCHNWLPLTEDSTRIEIDLGGMCHSPDLGRFNVHPGYLAGGLEELRGGGGGGGIGRGGIGWGEGGEKQDEGKCSLGEAPERDFSRPKTPTAIPTHSKRKSQSESPRLHFQAMQEQNLAGISSLQPLMDPVEGFLEQSSDDEPDPARLQEERRTLRRSRVKLVKLHSRLRVKQYELRQKELAKVGADKSFMKFVRQNIAKPLMLSEDPLQHSETLRQDLDQYFQEMQKARDEYGPLEDEYNQLLRSFEDLEYQLERTEGRVYNRKTPKPTTLDSSSSSEFSPSDSNSVLGLSLSDQEPYAPLHIDYLSRLGDLDLALEKLAHMNQEFDTLHNEQETNARLGFEFDKGLETFLDGLPSKQAILKAEIANIQIDVEQLRVQCLEAGIDLEPSIAGSSASQTPDINKDTGDVKSLLREFQGPEIEYLDCSHSMFTLVLPILDAEKNVEKTYPLQDLITEFDEKNKSDRINRWLLYGLRTSTLDACRFAQYSVDFLGFFVLSKLQNDLPGFSYLSTWYTDGANMPPGTFEQGRTQSSNTTSVLSLRNS